MTNYINNQTVKFILPLVTEISPKMLFKNYFLGTFIGDLERPQWDGKILLAYSIPNNVDFAKLDAEICSLPNYLTSYDYIDKRIVVYVLSIPEKYIDSVEYILDGKYSNIDPVGKLLISKFWFDLTGTKIVESVLDDENHSLVENIWKSWGKDRSNYCVEGEYWFRPLFDEEIFDIDKF